MVFTVCRGSAVIDTVDSNATEQTKLKIFMTV
jgi:hypothetical protein